MSHVFLFIIAVSLVLKCEVLQIYNMLSIRAAVPVTTANSVHTSQRVLRRCGHRHVQAGFRSRRDWQGVNHLFWTRRKCSRFACTDLSACSLCHWQS